MLILWQFCGWEINEPKNSEENVRPRNKSTVWECDPCVRKKPPPAVVRAGVSRRVAMDATSRGVVLRGTSYRSVEERGYGWWTVQGGRSGGAGVEGKEIQDFSSLIALRSGFATCQLWEVVHPCGAYGPVA